MLKYRLFLVLGLCFVAGASVPGPTRAEQRGLRGASATATARRQQRDAEENPAFRRVSIDAIINKSIRDVRTDITPPPFDEDGEELDTPDQVASADIGPSRPLDTPRVAEHREFDWVAPGTKHRPLYFEEVNLERHGYSSFTVCQPVASAAHFFGTVPLLPFKMAAQLPCEHIYTLGHYRPGNCVPYRIHSPPWHLDAAVAEAGVIAGLILLVP